MPARETQAEGAGQAVVCGMKMKVGNAIAGSGGCSEISTGRIACVVLCG